MKIFIDSANQQEVDRFLSWGVCDGVTTNPSLMKKAGVKSLAEAKKVQLAIAKSIFPRPLSIEVTSDQPVEILKQARAIAGWAKNVMVKITVTDRNGESLLPVISQLAHEGISVNVTTILTLNQALMAAVALDNAVRASKKKAPFPHIVSVFAGRIADEYGFDFTTMLLEELRAWLDKRQSSVEIIVASVRTPEQFQTWALTGADILTVPPAVLIQSQISARTREGVTKFLLDAQTFGAVR